MAHLDKEILDYYLKSQEIDRLNKDRFILEKLRTKQILNKYLPPPPCQVLDIGGGAGAYSFFLAGKGYSVHLQDPVSIHIEQAKELQKSNKQMLASFKVGDAREIDHPSGSVDVVLFFGPLYHLIDVKDRRQALREAFRVLKKGGIFLGVGISKYASYMDGFLGKDLLDSDYQHIVENDIKCGRHINNTAKDYFTTAYVHHPVELREEIQQTGFSDVKIVAIEGPAWAFPDMEDLLLNDRKAADKILNMIDMMETDESIMGASAHFMGIGKKAT